MTVTADHVQDEVASPFDGRVVGTVARFGPADVDRALDAGLAAAGRQRKLPAHQRFETLLRAATIADERVAAVAETITAESGKTITEARGEAARASNQIRLAAFEGSQLYGDSLPLDAHPGTGLDKFGFTIPQPVGLMAAITPFNYPSLLVLHKIAPALAAGNAVVLKPATHTPLTALALAEIFWDAGVERDALRVVTGPGRSIGEQLCSDSRVRKISFTGSTATGEAISRVAGVKRLSLELGASCPTVVLPSADIEFAAQSIAVGGYSNAGQACISVQRVIVDRKAHGDLVDALVPKVRDLRWGDPENPDTNVGSLITEAEARRVEQALADAVEHDGARCVLGGERDGALVEPAIIDNVDPRSSLSQDELFGPAVAITAVDGIEEALVTANDTQYGLGAGLFAGSVAEVNRFLREMDAGVLQVNWTPLWRADLMPYGGLKASGIGKEGIRAAVREMVEFKTAVLHGRPW